MEQTHPESLIIIRFETFGEACSIFEEIKNDKESKHPTSFLAVSESVITFLASRWWQAAKPSGAVNFKIDYVRQLSEMESEQYQNQIKDLLQDGYRG